MATISVPINQTYSSGNVALTLNSGDLTVICAYFEWSLGLAVSSAVVSVNGSPITHYAKVHGDNGNTVGCYMAIAPYVSPSNQIINISLSPTDTGNGRLDRLTVIKLVPSSGYRFGSNYLISSGSVGRLTATSGSLNTLTNSVGDHLIAMVSMLGTGSSSPVINWASPASVRQQNVDDSWDSGWQEVTAATQISASANDTMDWSHGLAAKYMSAVGIAVRETAAGNQVIWWW